MQDSARAGEIRRGDEAHLLFAAVAAEPQRVHESQPGEVLRAGTGGRDVQALQEDVEGRTGRTPIPIGAVDAMPAATTEPVSTRSPWNWNVVVIFRPSPAHPPTIGTPAPSTEYAPRTISS